MAFAPSVRRWAAVLASAALSACSSSVGTSPMTPPVPQGSGYNGIVPNAAPQSRQQIASTVVPIPRGASSAQLAQLGGFTVSLDLAKPTAPAAAKPQTRAVATRATARPPAATAKPRATTEPTAAPSASPSPSAAPTSGPWKGKPTPTPTPSGPRVESKITIYPDGTQKPPGDGDSAAAHRVPVVKLVMAPSVDVVLYSLGALRFVIPPDDEKDDRGFTVALYETHKFHKDHFIDAQLDASVDNGVVRAKNAKEAHTLSKGHTYTVILFGDPLAQTPSAYSPPQYPGSHMQYSPEAQQHQAFPQQQQPGPNTFPTLPPFPGQPGASTPSPTPTPFHY